MERSYVFCGCQIYQGSSDKKSCWEWDIPTPKPKFKKISQSNPSFATPKRFDMDAINKRYSDNLYEPVNPPPLYGSGYNVHKDPETTSLDERMIDIPPELEIITSDGLDGLDMPDPNDGIDGEREWRRSFHPDPQDDTFQRTGSGYGKGVFTAGIRNVKRPKGVETPSAIRPLSNKPTISFSPETAGDDASTSGTGTGNQEVPSTPEPEAMETELATEAEGGASKLSPLEQLKSQAGKMKQRFSKISIPVRPKFNQWTGAAVKLARKTSGKVKSSRKGAGGKNAAADGNDQEVPEGEEGVGGWTEPLSLRPESSPRPVRPVGPVVASYAEGSQAEHAQQQQEKEEQIHQQEVKDQHKIQQQEQQQAGPSSSSSNQQSVPVTATPPAPTPTPEQLKLEEEKLKKLEEEKVKLELKQKADEELKRLKAEEKLQREKEQEDLKRLKAEEKLVKQREADEQKRLKLEEKQRLDKEREDLKREKMAEKLLKDKEKEELKKQKAEEKLLQEKLTAEINKAKQEEILKAKEEQDRAKAFADEARQMLAGDTDMSPQPIQEQQSSLSVQPQPVEYSDDEADIEIDYTNKQRAAQQQEEASTKPNQEKKRRIIDLDFTKRFKRSKTPPGRPDPPKQSVASRFKFSRFNPSSGPATPDNQLASQYASEIKARDADADADINKPDRKERLREPQIFVTQPSTDSDAASYAQSQDQGQGGSHGDLRGGRGRGRDRDRDFDDESEQPREYDEDDEDYMEDNDEERVPTPTKQDFKGKLKGFGKKSGQIAAATGKNVGQAMKSLGQGIKDFGVNAVQEVKAKQAAVKERDAEKKAAAAAALMQDGDMDFDDGGDAYKPSNSNERTVFKFKKRDVPPPPEGASGEDTGPMVIEVRSNRARQEEPNQQQQQQQQQSAPSSVPTTPGRRSRKSSAGSRNQAQAQNQSQAQQNGESENFVVHRSQLLGRADRDWESPLDLVQSRDQSEEPFSGNASSRDSPPGSSMASSTAHFHASRPGRAGVLEEIDSDEFFLRERGISEGEDEDEVNRFLAEELQKAFRPTRMNALDGFDLPTPPSKPGRSPRKPPRKDRDSGNSNNSGAGGRDDGNDDDDNDSTGAGEVSAAFRKYQKQSDANKNRGNNFQTFPPERPKRKRTGYVSSYMNENQEEEEQEEEEEEEGENERYRQGGAQNEEEEEDGEEIIEEDEDAGFEDEGIRRVKEELSKIDKELDDYEPVNDQPVKPDRRRRKLPKPPSPPQSQLYYNTIAANEWVRNVESQIEADLDDGGQTPGTEAGKKKPIQLNLVDDTSPHQAPVAPRRTKSKSSLAAQIDSEELNFVDDEIDLDESRRSRPTSRGQRPIPQPPLAHGESEGQIDDEIDDSLDYVDEAGYAIVHKDLPKTFPRKNKNKQNKGAGSSSGSGGGSKGNSLKRRSREIRPGQGPNAGDSSGISAGGAPGTSGAFFSLPRYTPRTYHIVPPTRPHRTYSVLRPKRPPRNKSKSKSNLTLEVQGQGTPRTGSATGLAAPSSAAGSSTNFNTIGSTNSGTGVGTGPGAGAGTGTGGGRPLTPSSPALRRDEDRPSTAIGIMHGRPLPPPPRPDRAPAPLNDLDQASIERVVNLRHYANYEEEEDDSSLPEVQEEPFTATNIPPLTTRTATGTAPAPTATSASTTAPTRNNVEVEEEDLIDDLDLDVRDVASNNDSIVANSGGSRSLATSDINVAVQTDPVQDDDEYELNIAVGSFEEEIERSEIEKHSSVTRLPSNDQTQAAHPPTDEEQQIPPPIPQRPSPPLPARPQLEAPQIVFPTRLHLDELEVDVLRVNDLTANSLIIQQIRAPHIDLNSISSRGPLSIPSIQTSNLNVDNLDCNRITTNNITTPESEVSSVPPPSFYNLRSPVVSDSLGSSTEVEDCKIDNNDSGESCCPPDQSSPDYENVQNQNSESECPCVVEGSEAESDSTTCVPPASTTTNNTAATTASTAVNAARSRVPSLPVQASEISVISHITDPDIEDIAHSSIRLGRALVRVTVRSLQAMAEFVETAASSDPECQEQQRSHMQILLCLLLVLVAGIILLGRSGSMEPRWQYFLPPHDM